MRMKISIFLLTFLTPFSAFKFTTEKKDWWKKAVFYQIYPRSFLDTNADGIGDLKGIESKLDYIQSLGIGATWLSPIYESPMKDFGYDISNYTAIAPIFGTMNDFKSYVQKSHAKGLKVILDFVPNHSSNEHEWFKKSEQKEDPYTDYYVWVDGKESENGTKRPPNNWISVFGGSTWEWSEKRKQFYYHAFLKEQPDLNFRNPKLREEIKKVIRFWLDQGVDGFRNDAVAFLLEDKELRNEPVKQGTNLQPTDYDYYEHIYTNIVPGILDVLSEWRKVYDEYEKRDGLHRLMMLETYLPIQQLLPLYGNSSHPIADMPFNMGLISNITQSSTAMDVYKTVKPWTELPDGKWGNWILGNHDSHRVANRTRYELVDAMHMISQLLIGTAITYYGEEIGMVDTYISWKQVQDPFGKRLGPENYQNNNRDPERTPMQWDDTRFSGFTTGNTTWLPVNDNFKWLNVKLEEKNPRSHLNTYKKILALRKDDVIFKGSVDFPLITETVFSFTRTLKKNRNGYIVIINFGNREEIVNLESKNTKEFSFPEQGIAVIYSDKMWPNSIFPHNVKLRAVSIAPNQGVVIAFHPNWLK